MICGDLVVILSNLGLSGKFQGPVSDFHSLAATRKSGDRGARTKVRIRTLRDLRASGVGRGREVGLDIGSFTGDLDYGVGCEEGR